METLTTLDLLAKINEFAANRPSAAEVADDCRRRLLSLSYSDSLLDTHSAIMEVLRAAA
jgi:hypothetical protein